MSRLPLALALLAAAGSVMVSGQAPAALRSAEPFKLGTFLIDERPAVGIVLRDSLVVDLAAANRDLQLRPDYVQVSLPADMLALIGQYEYGMQRRLYEIVNALVADGRLAGPSRPAYVYDVAKVRALAPIQYPSKMLHAAGNYYGHVSETSPPEEQRKVAEQRRRDRGTPYLFMKATRGAIIGNTDPIVLPRGRTQIDWECELGVVIGRVASTSPPGRRWTTSLATPSRWTCRIGADGGARRSRARTGSSGKARHVCSDGSIHRSEGVLRRPDERPTAPDVNGQTMQDSRSSDMIHNISELIEFGSTVMSLFPGDVIAAGSPAGTGMSRSVRPEQVFLKPGDKIVATIDGIGTLTHAAVAEPPAPGTGSRQ
jgi:2,4-diketo-3-deoxy-L-fuconate hydrolase